MYYFLQKKIDNALYRFFHMYRKLKLKLNFNLGQAKLKLKTK